MHSRLLCALLILATSACAAVERPDASGAARGEEHWPRFARARVAAASATSPSLAAPAGAARAPADGGAGSFGLPGTGSGALPFTGAARPTGRDFGALLRQFDGGGGLEPAFQLERLSGGYSLDQSADAEMALSIDHAAAGEAEFQYGLRPGRFADLVASVGLFYGLGESASVGVTLGAAGVFDSRLEQAMRTQGMEPFHLFYVVGLNLSF